MKIKQLRQVVAGLFPAQFAAVFARAYTAKEISLVAEAVGIAAHDAQRREIESVQRECAVQAEVKFLKAKIQTVEAALERSQQVVQVREPVESKEEVFLIPSPHQPPTAGDMPGQLRNKIGLIKAVREVSDLGLKEAKDLVEDVLDRGLNKSVFKGSLDKAAVADRILKAAGGTTLRKEAF